MAIIWMEGFDHYGPGDTGKDNMLNGVWAELFPGGFTLTSSFSRTGTYAFQMGGGNGIARRVFPQAAFESGGVGFAMYMPSLPTADNAVRFQIRDVSNNVLITLSMRTNGALLIYRGNTTELLFESLVPNFIAEAWQHFEFAYGIDVTEGYVEARLNGVTIGNVSEVNTRGSFALSAQAAFVKNTDVGDVYIDDLFAWDTAGDFNNDFIGDRRVLTLYPDADTEVSEMAVIGTAEGWQAIDEVNPDDDTSYIEGLTPTGSPLDPVRSEFGIENVPAEVVAITAVQPYVRMRKTDAAVCNMQTSLVSNGVAIDGADRPITEQWTYWFDVLETDPDTGALWTPEAFNAARLRLARTE